MKKSLAKLLEQTRNEQNAYLAILQDKGADHPPRKLVKAKTERQIKKLVDNLNENDPK